MKWVLSFGRIQKRDAFAIILLALIILPTSDHETHATQQSLPFGTNPSAGHYLQTKDAKIYYEIYGEGEPIVLLHGGLFGYIDEFAGIISKLSRNQKVIAIATRGHGKSELGIGPLSYQLFAEDFAAIIHHVTTQQVNVLGFSDGAIAGYHLAVEHPELVRRFIAAGGPLGQYGYAPAGLADLNKYDSPEKLERLAPEFVSNRKQIMPDQKVWRRFVEELVRIWKQPEYISREKVRSIRCPVLVVAGDRDEYVGAEHYVQIYRLLPKGQLAILPHCSHVVFESKPELMRELIQEFLHNPL